MGIVCRGILAWGIWSWIRTVIFIVWLSDNETATQRIWITRERATCLWTTWIIMIIILQWMTIQRRTTRPPWRCTTISQRTPSYCSPDGKRPHGPVNNERHWGLKREIIAKRFEKLAVTSLVIFTNAVLGLADRPYCTCAYSRCWNSELEGYL